MCSGEGGMWTWAQGASHLALGSWVSEKGVEKQVCGAWLQAAASCHFFLKLIKGVLWFPSVSCRCGKDPRRSIEQVKGWCVCSSWRLAGAVRRDSGCADSFVLALPLGMSCWLIQRHLFHSAEWQSIGQRLWGCIPGEAALFSGFEAEMGEAVAGFALREGVLPSARVLGSASNWNEVTSLSADWVRGWFGKMLISMAHCLVLWVAAGIRKEVIGRGMGVKCV